MGDEAESSVDTGTPSPKRRRRRTYAGEVREALRSRILTGELKPGERIGELATAEEFDTSQGPVREALAALRAEGLLVRLGRRGSFVSPVSMDDAVAAYEVRLRVEPLVSAMATDLAAPADFAQLRSDIASMRQAAAARSVTEFVQHDMEFHGRIYSICGSPVYARVWDAVRSSTQMFNSLFGAELFELAELTDLADEHELLLTLLERGDAKGLKVAVEDHLREVWKRVGSMSHDVEAVPADEAIE